MSTGNINLDILLNKIRNDAISGSMDAVDAIRERYPSLSEKEAEEIHQMIGDSVSQSDDNQVSLVVTAPPNFALKTKTTKIVMEEMLGKAKESILITSYAMSDYFNDLMDSIIKKSGEGVAVKFFLNDIDDRDCYEKLKKYKGHFLHIYNYPKQDDAMSALHAKVISVDKKETLITSANLSYHGQEGNIELGADILSKEIGEQIEDIFSQLIMKKLFIEIK